MTPKSGNKPNAPWYTKVFVVFHLVCITIWAMPSASQERLSGRVKTPPIDIGDQIRILDTKYLKPIPPLQGYLFVTGVWQYWDMFAPNPADTDIWVDSEVIYKNGVHQYFLYPRMFLLSIPEKLPQERFRKFLERASADAYSYLWPTFAERIALLNDDRKNPPVTVRLTRHWMKIAGVGKAQPTTYNRYTYFEYAVDPRQLGRLRNSG